ncbi:MAG: LuxR C-terminal-related transcriptional regulator, partial [Chloroflexi bacterium]|nr:LuxR C-terminal-related transcriptional regulator [Chloroflexota bacterium]
IIDHDKDLLAYAQMLPLIAQGFRIYSPAVSETLSHVVVRHPDPLDDNEWQIVELIARGLSTLKIKEETHFSESTIADKISRMARRLNALGHITVNTEDRRPIPNRYRDALSRFYKENAVRYGRHRRP